MNDFEELIPASDEYRKSEDSHYEGKVVEHKASLTERVIKFLIADEVDDIQTYVVKKVKSFVTGMIGDFFGRISDSLVGSAARDGRRGGYYDDGYTSYRDYYDKKERSRSRDDDRPRMSTVRNRFDYREYGFERRRDAQEALEEMRRYIRERGKVRVDEYYYICTHKNIGDYTDRYFGWRDINGVTITLRRDNRYYLDLPRPIEFG